jgi:hypothetical protein
MEKKLTNIQKLVKRNLHERYIINESFKEISLEEDEHVRLSKTIDTFGRMIDEGYDNENIERVVEEQYDFIKKMFGIGTGSYDELDTRDKILTTGGNTALSQFKEYLVDKVLAAMGFKGPLARALSTAISEIRTADIISVFRSREGCMLHSATIAKGLIEGMLRIIFEYTEDGSMGKKLLRNAFSEIIHNSGYTKMIGQYVCTAAHNVKNNVGKQMDQNTNNTTSKPTSTTQPPPRKPAPKPVAAPKELG